MNAAWSDLFATYSHAYLAALIIALGCSIAGVYVVLRKVAFVGIATAQVAAAGVALAFLLDFAPLPAAVLSALIGVSLFGLGRDPVRVSRDGIVGVAFALASALAVLFVSRSAAELDQVEHIIYGSLLFTTGEQVLILALGVAAVLLVHALFHREFLMVSVDREAARTLGVRTKLFDFLLFLTLGAVIALSIGAAGSLLAFAFLILPPMTGLLLGGRLTQVFAISAACGLAAAVAGVLVSVLFDFPTGPAVVVTSAALFACALAARTSPALGAGALALFIAATALSAIETARPAAPERPSPELRIELELAAHDRTVRRGEPVAVDYVVRIRGEAPAGLHLALDAGSAVGIARLPRASARSAGRVLLDSSGLAPGAYSVSGSFWTGNPLSPDEDTELLRPDQVAVSPAAIEVLP